MKLIKELKRLFCRHEWKYYKEVWTLGRKGFTEICICPKYGTIIDFGLSPSGKAQHFDCCIRRFESD